ncbi:hypothetical protein ACFL1F_01245, partial [Chlamydiota bacterium]
MKTVKLLLNILVILITATILFISSTVANIEQCFLYNVVLLISFELLLLISSVINIVDCIKLKLWTFLLCFVLGLIFLFGAVTAYLKQVCLAKA